MVIHRGEACFPRPSRPHTVKVEVGVGGVVQVTFSVEVGVVSVEVGVGVGVPPSSLVVGLEVVGVDLVVGSVDPPPLPPALALALVRLRWRICFRTPLRGLEPCLTTTTTTTATTTTTKVKPKATMLLLPLCIHNNHHTNHNHTTNHSHRWQQVGVECLRNHLE